MASLILLCLFIFNLATLIIADGSLKVGDFTKDSKLVYHGNFDARGIFFLKRKETFEIQLNDEGNIKAIDIQDKRGDSSSWILDGGVDHDFVIIKLESKRGSGYNFVIDVYVYDDENTDEPTDGNKEKYPEEVVGEEDKPEDQTEDNETADKQPDYLDKTPEAEKTDEFTNTDYKEKYPEEVVGEQNRPQDQTEDNEPKDKQPDNTDEASSDKSTDQSKDNDREKYPEEVFGEEDKPEDQTEDNETEDKQPDSINVNTEVSTDEENNETFS